MAGLKAQSSKPLLPEHYGPNDTITVYATLMPDGSLVPTTVMPWVEVLGKMPRWLAKEKRKMTRLRNAVYVTYPYAREAGSVLARIDMQLKQLPSEAAKKEFIKSQERLLKTAFGDKVTNLSVYQGKVLMKLINRQTGINVYDILKEYKGGANARLWQTIAFFFGSSLKQDYDAANIDAEIEMYAREVELLYSYR